MPLAEYSLMDVLYTTVMVFLFIIWLWILVAILSDLFRDPELSGLGKAAWMICLIILPYLSAFVYLISRGKGMHMRTLKDQQAAKQQMDEYIRTTAGSSPADELQKLVSLRDSGAISAEEFESMKAKYVG